MCRTLSLLCCLLAIVLCGCAPAGGGAVANEAAPPIATPAVGPCIGEPLPGTADCGEAQMSTLAEAEEDCGCDE